MPTLNRFYMLRGGHLLRYHGLWGGRGPCLAFGSPLSTFQEGAGGSFDFKDVLYELTAEHQDLLQKRYDSAMSRDLAAAAQEAWVIAQSLGLSLRVSETPVKIVRLYDMMDGWIDVSGPVTPKEAERIYNEKTKNGTRNTKYADGDYYAIFDADTRMMMTPEFLGR